MWAEQFVKVLLEVIPPSLKSAFVLLQQSLLDCKLDIRLFCRFWILGSLWGVGFFPSELGYSPIS